MDHVARLDHVPDEARLLAFSRHLEHRCWVESVTSVRTLIDRSRICTRNSAVRWGENPNNDSRPVRP